MDGKSTGIKIEKVLCEICEGEVVSLNVKFICKACGYPVTEERKAEILMKVCKEI